MEQPTIWQWFVFWVSVGLTLYAFWHLIAGLLSRGRVEEQSAPARRSAAGLQAAEAAGGWLFRWIYWPLWLAICRTARLVWELPGILWRGQRHDEEEDEEESASTVSAGRPLLYVVAPLQAIPPERNETAVAATDDEARNVIAITQTERNEPLSRNSVTRAQAELIARLLKSESLYVPDGKGGYKKLGQTALIELALGLAPNGRPDSDYGKLKAELDPLLKPQLTVAAGRRDQRVIEK